MLPVEAFTSSFSICSAFFLMLSSASCGKGPVHIKDTAALGRPRRAGATPVRRRARPKVVSGLEYGGEKSHLCALHDELQLLLLLHVLLGLQHASHRVKKRQRFQPRPRPSGRLERRRPYCFEQIPRVRTHCWSRPRPPELVRPPTLARTDPQETRYCMPPPDRGLAATLARLDVDPPSTSTTRPGVAWLCSADLCHRRRTTVVVAFPRRGNSGG